MHRYACLALSFTLFATDKTHSLRELQAECNLPLIIKQKTTSNGCFYANKLKYKTPNLTESNLEFLRCGFGRSKFKIKLKIWRKFYKFKMHRIYRLNLYRLRKFDRPAATNLYPLKRRFCLFQIVFVRVTRGSGPSGFAFRRYGITRIVWHRLAHFSKLLDDFRIDRALAVKLA